MTSNKPIREVTCADFQEQLPDLFAAGGNGVPEDPDLMEHPQDLRNLRRPRPRSPVHCRSGQPSPPAHT